MVLNISAEFYLFNKQYLELKCLKKVRGKVHETSFFKTVYHPLCSSPLFLLVTMEEEGEINELSICKEKISSA